MWVRMEKCRDASADREPRWCELQCTSEGADVPKPHQVLLRADATLQSSQRKKRSVEEEAIGLLST